MGQEPLPWWSKLAYGAGDLGFSISYTILGLLFLFFLTDVAGLSPALAGTAILVGKAWDAVIDPYLGHLSDRTVSRWGRRRVFMLFGFLPYGLSFWLVWQAPRGASQPALLFWAAAVYILHTTATSVVAVPYTALTPELAPDYDERTSLTAYRMLFSILGGLIAAAVPLELVRAAGGGHAGFAAMGLVFGLCVAVTPLFPFFGTRERRGPEPGQSPLWPAVRAALKNRAFQIALGVYLLTWISFDVVGTVLVYFIKYVLGMEAQTSLLLGLMFCAATACLPFWVWACRRWDKRRAYFAGLSLLGLVMTAVAFLTPSLGHLGYPLAALAGIGVAAAHVIPSAIVPDVIEDDQLRTGRRREGDFFGVISFAQTLASSAAIFLVGLGLEFAGYVPGGVQPASAILTMRLLLGPLPVLLLAGAMVMLRFYPIDRRAHARMRAELAERARAAGDGTGPSTGPGG